DRDVQRAAYLGPRVDLLAERRNAAHTQLFRGCLAGTNARHDAIERQQIHGVNRSIGREELAPGLQEAPRLRSGRRRLYISPMADAHPVDNKVAVLILQHPQEQDRVLGTAKLLCATLANAKLTIGLSWRNLGHAPGAPA